ncbi:MAG: GNAT family N-acetyltransferase, partial [Flavobacteriaceae bacterium]|nr:GNAT family N-acetyltransferase [Flavobacteriaceae bacterium]
YEKKESYALIWLVDNIPVGHSNVNKIVYGQEAYMHLHLWNQTTRKKGMGTELVKRSIPFYFKNLKLKELFCEPYAKNKAPNKTLEKVGFTFIKEHETIPGSLNSLQTVKRWRFSEEKLNELKNK